MMNISNSNSWSTPIKNILSLKSINWQILLKPHRLIDIRSRSFTRMYSIDSISLGLVELLTLEHLRLIHVLGWLHDQNVHAIIKDEMLVALKTSTIIIDIDSFGGREATIPFLIDIHLCRPDLKVIAVSSEFSKDDWLTEMLEVADVCMSLPLSFARLDFALSEVEINNEAWRSCRKDGLC